MQRFLCFNSLEAETYKSLFVNDLQGSLQVKTVRMVQKRTTNFSPINRTFDDLPTTMPASGTR